MVYYVSDELPFIGYDFESGGYSDIVATQAPKCVKMGKEITLDVPGRDVTWSKVTFYGSMNSCGL